MSFKTRLIQQNYLVIVFLIIFVALASFFVYHFRIMSPTDNDYGNHILIAQNMLKNEPISGHYLSHPLLQIAQIGLLWISRSRIHLWDGTVILMVVSNVILVLSIYFWFGKQKKRGSDWLRAFWAVTLTFIAPFLLFTFIDNKYYFGYIGLANYHNPTIQLLRPFSLPIFILAMQVFKKQNNPVWMIVSAALLMVLSTLIKPNLAICLLPAMLFFSALAILQKKKIDWKLNIIGFMIPTVITLIWQYIIAYTTSGNKEAGIIFVPFVVESAFSGFLLPKFLLSIFFPLVIFLILNKSLLKNFEMQFSWFTFLVGAIQTYFFAEGGQYLYDGNFRWSTQITLLILFITSARFVYQRWGKTNIQSVKEKIIAYLAYLPHVASGIIYYLYCLLTTKYG
jgi:hypothetical protein